MLAALTGLGLSTAAGLNAYIPLLVVGVLANLTDAVKLPDGYSWLSNWGVLAVIAVLLMAEFVLDKVPAVDSVNDTIQTVVRRPRAAWSSRPRRRRPSSTTPPGWPSTRGPAGCWAS